MLYIDAKTKMMGGTATAGDIKKYGLFEASRKNGN